MQANIETILDVLPMNSTMRMEREALLGETRLRRGLIREISGEVEDYCNQRLSSAEDDNDNEQIPPR